MDNYLLLSGRRVLKIEAEQIIEAAEKLDQSFVDAINLLINCNGKVVLSGVGKSGHIARKIAATLASTGTPSFFVHPAEAGHGDLGMLTKDDVLIGISNSGESDEVINITSFAKRFGTKIIGMSGNSQSRLGQLSDVHLYSGVNQEACPLGIAPTASTAVQLAIGDALAMATLEKRGFTKEDFAARHPQGALGRRLYVRVEDIMQSINDVPHCSETISLLQAISLLATSRIGALVITDMNNKLSGIFTDSDLRRLIAKTDGNLSALTHQAIKEFMSEKPRTINSNELASEALRIFEENRISRLICINEGIPVGLISFHDLLAAKIT